MSEHHRIACQASIPPPGAECGYEYCRSPAVVRLVTHQGADPAGYCDLDWRRVRATILARGYPITDITGDVWALRAECPHWHIWECCTGLFYATANFDGQGTTVCSYLVGKLRMEIAAAQTAKAMARESAKVSALGLTGGEASRADVTRHGSCPSVTSNAGRPGRCTETRT